MTFAIIILNHSSFNTIVELNEALAASLSPKAQKIYNLFKDWIDSNSLDIREDNKFTYIILLFFSREKY